MRGRLARQRAVAVLQAEVPVHAGAGLVEEGLGREGGEEAELRGDLAREALEAEHRVGLRERLARLEVHLVLGVRGLVRVAARGNALQVAGGEQRVEVVGEVAGALQRVGLAGELARGRAGAGRGRVQAHLAVELAPIDQEQLQLRRDGGDQAGLVETRQHAAQRGARRQLARADVAAVALGAQRAHRLADHGGGVPAARLRAQGREVGHQADVEIGRRQQRTEHGLRLAGGERQAEHHRREAAARHADEIGAADRLAAGHRREVADGAFDGGHGHAARRRGEPRQRGLDRGAVGCGESRRGGEGGRGIHEPELTQRLAQQEGPLST